MPKGRFKTSSRIAREESERWILEELRRWPDGLRIVDLAKNLGKRVHKNTIRARLSNLVRGKVISYNKELKRFRLTDLSWDTIRRLEVLNIIRESEQLSQVFIDSEFDIGFPSAFIKYCNDAEQPVNSSYNKIYQLQIARFIERWILDIFSVAETEGLIRPELLDGRKGPTDITDNLLDRIWRKLFPVNQKILYVEMIDTKELLDFCKTSKGKARLGRLLSGNIQGDD